LTTAYTALIQLFYAITIRSTSHNIILPQAYIQQPNVQYWLLFFCH